MILQHTQFRSLVYCVWCTNLFLLEYWELWNLGPLIILWACFIFVMINVNIRCSLLLNMCCSIEINTILLIWNPKWDRMGQLKTSNIFKAFLIVYVSYKVHTLVVLCNWKNNAYKLFVLYWPQFRMGLILGLITTVLPII